MRPNLTCRPAWVILLLAVFRPQPPRPADMLLPTLLIAASVAATASASHLDYHEETTLLRAGLPQIGLYRALVHQRAEDDTASESQYVADEHHGLVHPFFAQDPARLEEACSLKGGWRLDRLAEKKELRAQHGRPTLAPAC